MDPLIARVPAPWRLHGEGHVTLFWRPPEGRSDAAPGASLRRGGLGALALLRYASSDVGPYDELLWLAPWGLRVGSRRLHSVCRIYVSSEESRVNGRLNWGIPKELARFEVERLSASAQRFRVTTSLGTVASFVVDSGQRAIPVGPHGIPACARQLGQIDAGRLFELTPSVGARASRARFSQLCTDRDQLVDCSRARFFGAVSLWDVELMFPEASVTRLAPAS